jgi:hypothetical protein
MINLTRITHIMPMSVRLGESGQVTLESSKTTRFAFFGDVQADRDNHVLLLITTRSPGRLGRSTTCGSDKELMVHTDVCGGGYITQRLGLARRFA